MLIVREIQFVIFFYLISGLLGQFRKENPNTVQAFGQPYDYVSVMHYSK